MTQFRNCRGVAISHFGGTAGGSPCGDDRCESAVGYRESRTERKSVAWTGLDRPFFRRMGDAKANRVPLPRVLRLHAPLDRSDSPPEFADDIYFSPELVQAFVHAYNEPGDLVLDAFAGFGTTLRVAENLGREPIGFEILPDRAPARLYVLLASHPTLSKRWLTSAAQRLAQSHNRLTSLLGDPLEVQVAQLLLASASTVSWPCGRRRSPRCWAYDAPRSIACFDSSLERVWWK